MGCGLRSGGVFRGAAIRDLEAEGLADVELADDERHDELRPVRVLDAPDGLVKRFESYETIGGLFAEVTCQTVEMSIVDKIWLLIVEVVTSIAEQISADYDELMESTIHWKQTSNSHVRPISFLATSCLNPNAKVE